MINRIESFYSECRLFMNECKIKAQDKITNFGRSVIERLPHIDPKVPSWASNKKFQIISFSAFTGLFIVTAYKVWGYLNKEKPTPSPSQARQTVVQPAQAATPPLTPIQTPSTPTSATIAETPPVVNSMSSHVEPLQEQQPSSSQLSTSSRSSLNDTPPSIQIQDPQKYILALQRVLDHQLMTNAFKQGFNKLVNSAAQVANFPGLDDVEFFSELISLNGVAFPDKSKDWASLYAKIKLINNPSKDRKLHRDCSLAKNAHFVALLDRYITDIAPLVNYSSTSNPHFTQSIRDQSTEILLELTSVRNKLKRTPNQAAKIFNFAENWPELKRTQIHAHSAFFGRVCVLDAEVNEAGLNQSNPLIHEPGFLADLRKSMHFFGALGMSPVKDEVTAEMTTEATEISEFLGDFYDKLQRTPYQATIAAEKRASEEELARVNQSWPTAHQLATTAFNPFPGTAQKELTKSLHEIINGLHTKDDVHAKKPKKEAYLLSNGISVPMHAQGIADLPRTPLLIGEKYFPAKQENAAASERRLDAIFNGVRSLFTAEQNAGLKLETLGNIVTLANNQSLFAPFQDAAFSALGVFLTEDPGTRLRAITVNAQNELVFTSSVHYRTQQPMDWDERISYKPKSASLIIEIAIPKETILETGLEGLNENAYRVRYFFNQG